MWLAWEEGVGRQFICWFCLGGRNSFGGGPKAMAYFALMVGPSMHTHTIALWRWQQMHIKYDEDNWQSWTCVLSYLRTQGLKAPQQVSGQSNPRTQHQAVELLFAALCIERKREDSYSDHLLYYLVVFSNFQKKCPYLKIAFPRLQRCQSLVNTTLKNVTDISESY